jgi:hypothetical protein
MLAYLQGVILSFSNHCNAKQDCKKKYNVNSKKGCPNCLAELFGGASPAKGKKK